MAQWDVFVAAPAPSQLKLHPHVEWNLKTSGYLLDVYLDMVSKVVYDGIMPCETDCMSLDHVIQTRLHIW